MRSLNDILIEGLSDWSDDKLGKRMDKLTSEETIKNEIIGWVINNTRPCMVKKTKFKFDFSTSPITVNYGGDITFKTNITSLTNGIFQWGETIGDFQCNNCASLKSLDGSPKEVGGNFECYNCDSLKSLEGAPNKVGGWFDCSNCDSLKSLEGAPKKVGGKFYCMECHSLKSLEGAPKEVGGDFYCKDCGVQFTEDDVKKVSNVKNKIYC